MDYKTAVNTLKKVIVPLGERLVSEWDNITVATVKDEEQLDIATTLDQEIEQELIQTLKDQFPQSGLLVEESTHLNEEAEYRWAIDPIDGTKYYASRIPLFTISVGLLKNMKPELGVIYNPISRQLYTGSTNMPATLNGQAVHIRPEDSLARSIISIDFHGDPENTAYAAWEKDALHHLHTRAYRIRVLGSGSLSLAWIASGSIMNAYVATIPPTKWVDVAAGLALSQAAGAQIEIIPHPVNTSQKIVVVGTKEVVKQITAIVR